MEAGENDNVWQTARGSEIIIAYVNWQRGERGYASHGGCEDGHVVAAHSVACLIRGNELMSGGTHGSAECLSGALN